VVECGERGAAKNESLVVTGKERNSERVGCQVCEPETDRAKLNFRLQGTGGAGQENFQIKGKLGWRVCGGGRQVQEKGPSKALVAKNRREGSWWKGGNSKGQGWEKIGFQRKGDYLNATGKKKGGGRGRKNAHSQSSNKENRKKIGRA